MSIINRGILVVGTGRSGTSMVAGVCYHLGVNMGDTLVHPNQWNQYRYFEDMEFHVLLQSEDIDNAKKLVESKRGLWGVKNPLLCHYVNDIMPSEGDYRIIVAHRLPEKSIQSYMKAYGTTITQAINWYKERSENLHANLLTLKRQRGLKVFDVDFDDFRENKKKRISELCKFIYEGYKQPEDIERAVNFVR